MIFRSVSDRSEIGFFVSLSLRDEASAGWVTGLLDRAESRLAWCRMALSDEGGLLAAHVMDSWSFDHDPGDTPTFVLLLGHTAEDAAAALLKHDLTTFATTTLGARLGSDLDAPADLRALREGQQRILEEAGFAVEVDRVRLHWAAPATTARSHGLRAGRLTFRPASTLAEDDLVALFAAVSDGSVDHGMITGRAEHGRRQEAVIRFGQACRRKYHDDWFVVGMDSREVPVGYVQSALDQDDLGFLAEVGVAESQRGHRYVDELLGYGTNVLASRGETRIRAYTDAANRAMRAAFARGGYTETGTRRDFRLTSPR